MKKSLLLFTCLFTLGVTAQTMKYKDIYSLIKAGKKAEALPHLLTFLKEEPKHANGNYWAGKIYYEKAQTNSSSQQADSSIMYFKQSMENISVLDVNMLNASRFPDFTGTDATVVLDNGKKWMQGKIAEIEGVKRAIQEKKSVEETEKKQVEWASKNTGENDPMVVAKKYFEADKNCDIKTLIELGKKDEKTGKIGQLRQESIDAYNKDKASFVASWKKETLTKRPDFRLTDNNNQNDYPWEEMYDKESHSYQQRIYSKKPMNIIYKSENEVEIKNIVSYKGHKSPNLSLNEIGHLSMYLEKVNGKWLVVAFN